MNFCMCGMNFVVSENLKHGHMQCRDIYNVGTSTTVVKLKVNGQLEIFSKVNSQATIFL